MRVFFSLFFWLGIAIAPAHADTSGEVPEGSLLREAAMQGLNVPPRKLSEYRGKPLIINVWASWCGPCRAEMGSLDRLARRYGGKKLNVIGISTDDDRNAADEYVRQAKLSFANYLDSKVFLENMLGANTIPLTVLVDAQGRVLLKVRGAREWDSPQAIKVIGEIFNVRM